MTAAELREELADIIQSAANRRKPGMSLPRHIALLIVDRLTLSDHDPLWECVHEGRDKLRAVIAIYRIKAGAVAVTVPDGVDLGSMINPN